MDKPTEGFTLIETMVVLMVMGVLVGIGMPSFLNLIEKIRTESEAEILVESLRTARLTAIEERKDVVICTSNNGTDCNGTWKDGFILFRNTDGNDTRSSTEEILFQHQFRTDVTVKTGSGTNQNVFFNPNGWTPGSAESLLVCAKAGSNTNGYRIVINRAGRLRIEDSSVVWKNASGVTLNC
jgi:type IV fimbrial biogenesis protein FimT